eukprot:3063662-Amphidinium_carterae.2
MSPTIRTALADKRILLLGKLLREMGYPDKNLISDLVGGSDRPGSQAHVLPAVPFQSSSGHRSWKRASYGSTPQWRREAFRTASPDTRGGMTQRLPKMPRRLNSRAKIGCMARSLRNKSQNSQAAEMDSKPAFQTGQEGARCIDLSEFLVR